MSDPRYDPNRDPNPVVYEFWPNVKWLVAGALLFGLAVFAFTNERSQTASTTPIPPAETTGSGNINQPALPNRLNTRP